MRTVGHRHPEHREGSPRIGSMRTTGGPSAVLGMTLRQLFMRQLTQHAGKIIKRDGLGEHVVHFNMQAFFHVFAVGMRS
jgi:hypothetical protein